MDCCTCNVPLLLLLTTMMSMGNNKMIITQRKHVTHVKVIMEQKARCAKEHRAFTRCHYNYYYYYCHLHVCPCIFPSSFYIFICLSVRRYVHMHVTFEPHTETSLFLSERSCHSWMPTAKSFKRGLSLSSFICMFIYTKTHAKSMHRIYYWKYVIWKYIVVQLLFVTGAG